MAEPAWTEQPPLARLIEAGRPVASADPPGVRLTVRAPRRLVQVMARRGGFRATVDAARGLFGSPPPSRPEAVFTADATLVWSGPGQFLVLDHAEPIDDPAAALRTAFAGTASVVDQSHGRVEIEVAGRQARAMLAKLCSLDLAAPAFAVGAAAATSIDHTNVTLWREPDDSDGPVFRFLVFSTFAESLWHLFTASAAEFGAAKGLR
ncbi:MAG: sarcosine oxidase subunit gamma [Mesorhizobium sp.]